MSKSFWQDEYLLFIPCFFYGVITRCALSGTILFSLVDSYRITFKFGKAWFPLDRNEIVKSRDSSRFLPVIVKRLIEIENKNLTEIASDLQRKRFLS